MQKTHISQNTAVADSKNQLRIQAVLRAIIYFWAVCDLLKIVSQFVGWASFGEVPVVTPICGVIKGLSVSSATLAISRIFLAFIDISVYFSSFYLLKQHKYAAYICYVQAPIRWFVGCSSIPMINSFSMSVNGTTSLIITTMIMIKLTTIILWHRINFKK